jgi:hypothetical protein
MGNESNKITAVEWLWEQIDEILPFSVDTETGIKLYNAKEQAKEMEKEQIMDASGSGWSDGVLYSNGEIWNYQSPEHYYTETYGGNK